MSMPLIISWLFSLFFLLLKLSMISCSFLLLLFLGMIVFSLAFVSSENFSNFGVMLVWVS